MPHFKKVVPGAFPQLGDYESRILIMRHGDHQGNIIAGASIATLQVRGRLLKEAGIKIDTTTSSPADRALVSAYFLKVGMGQGGHTYTDDRLCDERNEGDRALIARLRSSCPQGAVLHQYLFDTLCPNDIEMWGWVMGRGIETVNAIESRARSFLRQTMLFSTHGGTRIEPAILYLQEKCIQGVMPECIFQPMDMAELLFDIRRPKLLEVNYLDFPAND